MQKTSKPLESGQEPEMIQAVESKREKKNNGIQALDKKHIQMLLPMMKNSQLKTLQMSLR